MIRDLKGLSVRAEGNDCVVGFEGGETPEVGNVQLLLDARGHLVGVDLGGAGLSRTTVMLGAHEDVTETRPAHVTVGAGWVRIRGAAKLAR